MKTAIVIPTIGRASLARAIASCQNQIIPPDEIIVVNDGLTKVRVPERVRLVNTSGKEGPAAARKLGTESISPDIQAIGYVDDDDELLPNHISSLLPLLKDNAFAFSRSSMDDLPYDPNILVERNVAPISSFMHNVWALAVVGGWSPEVARMEDWDLWGRLAIEFGPPATTNEVTNTIVKNGRNISVQSEFAYSLMCSWRDMVSDKLKFLSSKGTGRLSANDPQFRMPKVGVVLPVFNAEKYIRSSIESLLTQDFTDFEILLINDGSTDNSVEQAMKAANGDKRLRVFHQDRAGVTNALNHGLLTSRSELIARMDADDVSVPSRFSSQVQYLDKNKNVDILGSYFLSMNEDLSQVIWENTDIPTKHLANELKNRCCIGHPTTMYRRAVIEELNGYDLKWNTVEDYELWLRAASMGKIIENLPQVLLKHRIHGGQVSTERKEFQALQAKEVRKYYGSSD